jgi:hypothetical protein
MIKQTRLRQTKKLLVATLGVGTLAFASCAAFPGCNLMAPPPCDQQPDQYHCRDMSAPDLRAEPTDLGESD